MSHWYDKEGNPAYTIVGKNGKERNTTLADAKRLGLVPSVTTVMGCKADGYYLAKYKQDQLLEAAYNTPLLVDNTWGNWTRTVIKESRRHREEAAQRGSEIHDALEHVYMTGKMSDELDADTRDICQGVIDFMESEFQGVKWIAEESFTSRFLGFGGRVDMHSKHDNIVLDFKTKGKDDLSMVKAYDDHHMQTAAYAVGLGLDAPESKRYNLFVSTTTPGELKLTESTNFTREWGMFDALLDYWHLSNNYDLSVLR